MKTDYNLQNIFDSVTWRYFRNNFRVGVSIILFLNFFIFALAVGFADMSFMIFAPFVCAPFLIVTIYYLVMLRYLKRHSCDFIYETIVLNAPIKRGQRYGFSVMALGPYDRIAKKTGFIFNIIRGHYLNIHNFSGETVTIAHLEGKKRIYILEVKEPIFK